MDAPEIHGRANMPGAVIGGQEQQIPNDINLQQQQVPNDINFQQQQVPNDINLNQTGFIPQPGQQMSQEQYQKIMDMFTQQQQQNQQMINLLNQQQQQYQQQQYQQNQFMMQILNNLQNNSQYQQQNQQPMRTAEQQQFLREFQKKQAIEMGKIIKMQKEALENSKRRERERREQKQHDDYTIFFFREGKLTPIDFKGNNLVQDMFQAYADVEHFNTANAHFKFGNIDLNDHMIKYLYEIDEMTKGAFTNGSQVNIVNY